MMFEAEFENFLEVQKKGASGLRLEQLNKKLVGEKKMIQAALWPVFKSFEGFELEYAIPTAQKVTIFVDAVFHPLRFAFESEGFGPHAESIKRDRFSFERMRVRAIAAHGYRYIPFSWDELDQQPKDCQRSVRELIGLYSRVPGVASTVLSLYEREVIRYGILSNRPFQLKDVGECLKTGETVSRSVLQSLMAKRLVRPIGTGKQRFHYYILEEDATDYIL